MSKMVFQFTKVFFLLFITAAFISCNRSSQTKEEVGIDDFTVDTDIFEDITTAKKIFYSLPSPLETAMLIKSAGAEYNEQLLNPIENVFAGLPLSFV